MYENDFVVNSLKNYCFGTENKRKTQRLNERDIETICNIGLSMIICHKGHLDDIKCRCHSEQADSESRFIELADFVLSYEILEN